MQSIQPVLRELKWESLQERLFSAKTRLSIVDNADSIKAIQSEIEEIEEILYERADGFKKLSDSLIDYPNIDPAIRKLKNQKQPEAKKPDTNTYLSSVTGWFSYAATVYVKTLYSSVNVESAAEAKLIADNLLEKHAEESKREFASRADREVLRAIQKLRPVYNTVLTNGKIKKAIGDLFTSYHFPLDEKQFEAHLQNKVHSRGMLIMDL